MERTMYIRVLLNSEEYQIIRVAAATVRMSMSKYARLASLETAAKAERAAKDGKEDRR